MQLLSSFPFLIDLFWEYVLNNFQKSASIVGWESVSSPFNMAEQISAD